MKKSVLALIAAFALACAPGLPMPSAVAEVAGGGGGGGGWSGGGGHGAAAGAGGGGGWHGGGGGWHGGGSGWQVAAAAGTAAAGGWQAAGTAVAGAAGAGTAAGGGAVPSSSRRARGGAGRAGGMRRTGARRSGGHDVSTYDPVVFVEQSQPAARRRTSVPRARRLPGSIARILRATTPTCRAARSHGCGSFRTRRNPRRHAAPQG